MPLEDPYREGAARMRALLTRGQAPPALFRQALLQVPAGARDAWLDQVLGLGELPDDGPDLPRGCVPYLPCAVESLLCMVEQAEVRPDDIFVDLGAGLGRSVALTHFLTGASAIGIEIQSGLARAARALARDLNAPRISVVEGDAASLAGAITSGTVFFLYCPFSGARLQQVLDGLEPIARLRPIRVCCLDLPLPARPWLRPIAPLGGSLVVYRSSCHPPGAGA